MTNFWISTILLFAALAALITWVSFNYHKRKNSEKNWKTWLFSTPWEGLIVLSCGLTVLTVYVLKWTDILTF